MDWEVCIHRRSELSDLLHHSPVNNAADTDPSRPVQPPFSDILTLYFRSSKFPPNPLMPEIKWRRPSENQYRCVLRFIVLFYSRIGFIKDFIRYENDSGGFLVALVIRRCVNATEATMETARSVEEGWSEVKASVGC